MTPRALARAPAVLAVALLLGGCAAPRLYQWGGYDAQLSQAYRKPETVVAFRQSLEAHITTLEQAKQKVAPGLYAELGTLYFQAGDQNRALALYAKERDTWSESRGLMDALITNIGRQKAASAEARP